MNRKVRFLTNINCPKCKAAVEAVFKDQKLYTEFDVDYGHPGRIATFTLRDGADYNQIKRIINEAGYKAEVVEETSPIASPATDSQK